MLQTLQQSIFHVTEFVPYSVTVDSKGKKASPEERLLWFYGIFFFFGLMKFLLSNTTLTIKAIIIETAVIL